MELDVVLGKALVQMGVLVVEDPQDEPPEQQQRAVPGLFGVNIIGRCYSLLLEQFGLSLFESPVLKAVSKEWQDTFVKCEYIEASRAVGYLGKAKVHG